MDQLTQILAELQNVKKMGSLGVSYQVTVILRLSLSLLHQYLQSQRKQLASFPHALKQ